MAITKEEQDREFKKEGFYFYKDFEIPDFSPYDAALRQLSCLAATIKLKDDFLKELSKAKGPYHVIDIYHRNSEALKRFIRQQRALGKIDIPDIVFDLMDKYWEHEDFRDFIARDGGENRTGLAFKEDGVTVIKSSVGAYFH